MAYLAKHAGQFDGYLLSIPDTTPADDKIVRIEKCCSQTIGKSINV